MLKEWFLKLTGKYVSPSKGEELWGEIEDAYSSKKRYYHALTHLEHLLQQLNGCNNLIADMESVLFALFYHDAVYNVLKQDNEEKSALLAKRRMGEMGVPAETISKCAAIIRATKLHERAEDEDINLFTDADLSVLGSDVAGYSAYARSIRKEYGIYPDLLYNAGRKKVLTHFLGMASIYKTTVFRERYEEHARANLQRELELL